MCSTITHDKEYSKILFFFTIPLITIVLKRKQSSILVDIF